MSLPPEASSPPPAQVLVGLPMEPPTHGRLSVLFRLFLALPLIIAAAVLSIAAFFVLVIGWFAALIRGRMPDAFQDFLVGYHRMWLNVSAYLYLLTPTWPGLSFSAAASNQATLEVDQVQLNRIAVLFRIILAIPAYAVASFIAGLGGVYVFIMWVAALFTKRTPVALHQTVALILRFQTRASAYADLITPTQPFAGTFGDAAPAGPADRPTGWVVVPRVRVLLVLSIIAGVVLSFVWGFSPTDMGTPPTTY